MTTIKNAPQTLRAAADHIERVGLNQDRSYYGGEEAVNENDLVQVANLPCCIYGAIAVVTRTPVHDVHWDWQLNVLDPAIKAKLGRTAMDFSDTADSPEQVTALLREVADEIEKQEQN